MGVAGHVVIMEIDLEGESSLCSSTEELVGIVASVLANYDIFLFHRIQKRKFFLCRLLKVM